jgi:Zn-dependent oligopeptidase
MTYCVIPINFERLGEVMTRSLLLTLVAVALLGGCSKDTDKLSTLPAASNIITPVEMELPTTYDFTPGQFKAKCDGLLAYWQQAANKIAGVSQADAKFATTAQALENVRGQMSDNLKPLLILKDVSPDEGLRKASSECAQKYSKVKVELGMREDIYQRVKWAAEKKEALDPQDQQLINDILTDFKRNGMEVDPSTRARVGELRKRIVTLNAEYSERLAAAGTTYVLIDDSETEGLEEGFIKQIKEDSLKGDPTPAGKLKVFLSPPNISRYMVTAKKESGREKVSRASLNIGGEANRLALEELIKTRAEAARLLGYKTHADFVLQPTMAGSSETVAKFLENISTRLQAKGQADLAQMLELKKADNPGVADVKFNTWDRAYYENRLKKLKYNLDTTKIKEYFPAETVVAGMFKIYETIMNVQFKEITAATWEPKVKAYQILRDGKVLAHFYLDLYPRDNKYDHFAADDLVMGKVKADGSYQKPIAMVMGNFSNPEGDKPALMSHTELETLFHEFGHVMNFCLTRTKYTRYSGANYKEDFPEAPSQMLEHWVWEPKALALLSGHYKTGEKLPQDTIDRMVQAQQLNSGLFTLRQVALAMSDQAFHTSANLDGKSSQTMIDIFKKVAIIPMPDNTSMAAGWTHMASNDGAYDGRYYGYLWSQVYADDMYTRFAGGKLLDPEVGAEYVKWILEPGGTQNPFDLLKGFLGREPNMDAFFKALGA